MDYTVYVCRLMWPEQITLCGQWEQTSVINMLIHGLGRWISLFTMSIRCSSLQLLFKNVFLELLFCVFDWTCWFISFWVTFCICFLCHSDTLRMGVSMHYIPHHLSTLMQSMQLISNGLLKLMISSREFFLDTLDLDLCLKWEVRRKKGREGRSDSNLCLDDF